LLVKLSDPRVETNALPPNLRGKFRKEPLYSDLRWAKKATDLSLRHPQFLEEVGAIGATLHGRPKDELVGQDVRQRRIFKLAAGVVALLLVALTAGASAAAFYANEQRKEAVRQKRAADEQAAEARWQKDEADQQRQLALSAAEKERAAAQREREARDQAEQATENEKVARLQAE